MFYTVTAVNFRPHKEGAYIVLTQEDGEEVAALEKSSKA